MGERLRKTPPATFLCIHRKINFGIRPIFASIPDIYTKSNEAKEILDFYAVPDIAKKLDEYKKTILKEVQRYVRRAHRPRIPRIRATIKKFSILDPGDEAVGELMAFSIL